jgi:hypothetical protein
VEPSSGLVGEHTRQFASDLVRENWIGFALEGDRYRLLGDPRFFLLEAGREANPEPYDELVEHYESEEASIELRRAHFRATGELGWFDGAEKLVTGHGDLASVEQLGGDAPAGNWVDTTDFPVLLEDDELDEDYERAWPLSPSGNRFQHVASVPGWHYRSSGADSILLFFEPVERLALLTFDWS